MCGQHRVDTHQRTVPPHYAAFVREGGLLPVGIDVPTCTPGNVPYASFYSFTRGRAVDFVNAESKDYKVDKNTRAGINRDKAKRLLPRLAR